jgi:predicted mannosyl-3-phosphoglycerate phosphatase (HAD superfamily)
MEYSIRIQDLATDDIRELLLEEGSGLDEQQAAALKQFIEDIGGMENALAALTMLDELEKAA